MARYRHRRSRPLHTLRYGRAHYVKHRDGVRHRHRRERTGERVRSRQDSWLAVPPWIWPREIGRQIALGALVAFGVLALYAIIGGWWAFSSARSELTTAQDLGRHLIDHRSVLLTKIGRAQSGVTLAKMEIATNNADETLSSSPAITLLSYVPFVGTQVRAITSSVHDASVLTQQGQTLLQSANAVVAASHGATIDLASLAALDTQVHASHLTLREMVRPTSGLWGPAHTARVSVNSLVSRVDALLRNGGRALDFAQPFLGSKGPRTYFVAGQNNSEMRDQGAVLSWGLLHVVDGHFTMSKSEGVGALTLSQPAVAITDPGTREAFGALEPTRIWQSVNSVGDYPTSARWMIAMYAAARHEHVDGVVGVDVATLENILRVTGGVRVSTIPGIVDSANVSNLLLHDLYVKYPNGDQRARHDDVSNVAKAAIDKMQLGDYDLGAFANALAKSTHGRHLLFYDTTPRQEATVAAFGAAGGLLDQGLNVVHLSMQAGVAAKLDWYIHTRTTYNLRVDAGNTAYLTTTLTMNNYAPAHAKPSYALGPDNTNTHIVGEYIARIYEWLPPSALAPGGITEHHLTLVRTVVHVLPHNVAQAVLTAVIPHAMKNGVLTLHFIPQGAIHPSRVTLNFSSNQALAGPGTVTWTNDHAKTLTWRTTK